MSKRCTKIQYASREVAEAAMDATRHGHAYECNRCKKWHLTSHGFNPATAKHVELLRTAQGLGFSVGENEDGSLSYLEVERTAPGNTVERVRMLPSEWAQLYRILRGCYGPSDEEVRRFVDEETDRLVAELKQSYAAQWLGKHKVKS